MRTKMHAAVLVIGLSFFSMAATAQKQLKPEDYGKWQTLAATAISPNGQWTAWQVIVQKDNDSLFVKNNQTGTRYAIAFSSNPVFSGDNQWLAYQTGVSYKEAEQLEAQKKPIEPSVGYIHLTTGKKYEIKNATSAAFSKTGKFMTVSLAPSKGSTDKGSVLLLRNLSDSSTRTIGNVTAHSFNKKGDYLAYIVAGSNNEANSVELFDLRTYQIRVVSSDTSSFSQLTWQKEGEGFVFLRSAKNAGYEEDYGIVYAYTNLYKTPVLKVINNVGLKGFPAGMRISPSTRLMLSDDMSSVFFGINDWTVKPQKDTTKKSIAKKDSTAKDSTSKALAVVKKDSVAPIKSPPGLDIWHWKDEEIQPRQKLTYMQDKEATFFSVYNLDQNTFFQLADSVAPIASMNGNQKFMIIRDERKYKPAFKEDYADYYIVNVKTGVKKIIREKLPAGSHSASPDGKYIAFYTDKHWWNYTIATGELVNITENINTPFWNTRDDHPAAKPPFGMAGWTKGDKEVLLYDEYNVYAVQADGKKYRKLTNGETSETVFRITRTDSEKMYIDEAEPIILAAYGDKTKYSGYYQLYKNKVSELVYENRQINRLSKAKEAPVYTYIKQTYSESPSLIVAGNELKNPVVTATTNPQQKDYFWGKSELVNFTNSKGQKLQGALFYPADYQPGKKYPMVVYIYEILSNTVNGYTTPSERGAYNTTNFTTNGYFIFRPDIVYDINEPGMSAVNCVVPAVEEVLKTGMIDKDKVGIMGHSWGAYQTSFIITQTNIFKAAIAGAPLTDMISMSMSIYWNNGIPDQKIFETSQGRFDGPWYDRMEEHIRNSPMFQAKNINTPLMIAFGDKDGAVDWHQGIEMYGTMRRMQKPHIMLVYADENHGLAKKENQIDYQRRQMEFFEHYLLGKPAQKWITEGVKYMEKMKK